MLKRCSLDMVATLGETTGKRALEKMREQMLESESGRKILRERPIVHTSTIDFDNLRATCAPGTFGHEYVSWLDQQGVTPDTRDPVRPFECTSMQNALKLRW